MEIQIMNFAGEATGESISVADETFGRVFNEPLVHQVVTAYLAGARAGSKAQKSRSDVRGGGAKPWRQKGTGRARAGTSRSPIWRSGGVTFAAQPRSFSQKVNRKMHRAAMRSILSELIRQERLIVLDELKLEEPKTRHIAGRIRDLGARRLLLVSEQVDDNLYLATRNLPGVTVTDIAGINPANLVGADKVLVTAAALKRAEEALS
jgi:large subunit ribosomal protein L4